MIEHRRLRVLIVEDSPDDEELVVLELRRGGYDVVHERVETEAAMREALGREKWDVVLSDFSMPGFSGPEALAVVKSMGLDVPFIIVSGTVGEEVAVAAMRSGAHDYVLKGSLTRLCSAIERAMRDAALRVEQKRMEEQLLISDRMASVGTLAAGVAHELNNPLGVIIANLELMAQDLAEVAMKQEPEGVLQSVLEELQDARECADRLRHIVRDLKIFSRSPEMEEQRGPVNLRAVLDSSLRMAWNEIRHRARVVKAYGDVPPVAANEARLGQVFLNLIVNAAQAIVEGDVEHNAITVTTRMDPSGRVVVEVTDTGSGIPAEALPRIFDAFYTTKPPGVGTGLGLSICHRIVSGLGGDIRVESDVGRGTTFRVLLPPAHRVPEVEVPAAAPGPAARRGRVLVIDDEALIVRAVVRVLHGEHDVVVAASATDALRRIAGGEEFDLILCDLMMPQMTGMELHAEILRVAPTHAERMVFLTGGAFTPGARSFLDRVSNERVEKPFDMDHLRAVVNARIR